MAAVCALLAAACMLVGCTDPPRAPDVLLITVDTLRADYLGAYGGAEATPTIDALARDGAVFERSVAPMPMTRPSHFSMFTSLYPREHGVVNNEMALPDSSLSVAEIFADQGYRTGAFVGVRLLGPNSGAAQGFADFDYPSRSPQRRADDVVERALSWVDGLRRDEPYFLWLHVFDPHQPYEHPPGFRGSPAEGTAGIKWTTLVEIAARHGGDVPRETLEQVKALYRIEVAYVDHWLDKLLSGVSSRRDLDDTIVVFTADHGECFENGIYFEHADCLFEPSLQIPMIVRYPSMFPPGARSSTQTSILDVAPTLLVAAGFDVPASFSGRALQQIVADESRYVLVQHPFFQNSAARKRPQIRSAIRSVAGEPMRPIVIDEEKIGLVGRDWKYLRAGERDELYSMSPTPDESTNLAALKPEVVAEMKARLSRLLEQHPLTILNPNQINEELLETLKALGYVAE